MSVSYGDLIPYGVMPVMPLEGFPEGKTQIVMKNSDYVKVFVRVPTGGVRCFNVREINGARGKVWMPLEYAAKYKV